MEMGRIAHWSKVNQTAYLDAMRASITDSTGLKAESLFEDAAKYQVIMNVLGTSLYRELRSDSAN